MAENVNNLLKVGVSFFKYIYMKHTSNILQVYFEYISNIIQPTELEKKKYTSSLYYFDKRSTFETHFVKLNQHFNVQSILEI